MLLLLVGGVTYYLIVRNRPEDLGFQPVHYDENGDGGEENEQDEHPTPPTLHAETSWDRYRYVLSNPRFLIASVAIGFQSVARYGLIVWVPVHFLGADWKNSDTKWVSIALPIGMALGALTSGWLSDRFFNSNRSRVIGLFMLLAAGSAASMFLLPQGHLLVIPMLFLTGFFVYGPQSGFWALCPDLLGHRRAGTGTGIMNTFAYVFAGFGEPLIGWLIDVNDQTSLVFVVVAASCLLGALISLFIRR